MNRSYSASENRWGRNVTLAMIVVLGLLGFGLVGATSGQSGSESAQQAGDESGSASGNSETYSSDEASDFVTTQSTENTQEAATQSPEAAVPDDLSFLCSVSTTPASTDIPAEEREAMERAVERYVLTAYGDPGTDPAEYERSVEELAVEDCLRQSPAWDYVENGEGMAQQGGRQVAPVDTLDDTTFSREIVLFDPSYAESVEDEDSGASYIEVTGEAVWVSEESDGSGAVGKQQTLTLAKPEAGEGEWKVSYGQTIPPASYMDSDYQSELPPGVD